MGWHDGRKGMSALAAAFFFLDWDINMERFLQEDKRALRERVHLEKRAIEEFHLQTVNRCL